MLINSNQLNIITVEDLLETFPDLKYASGSNYEAITSAINQSTQMLDGVCSGKISKVWTYWMENQANLDTSNEWYRTTQQLGYLQQAILNQTRYYIQNGNSDVVGNDSLNMDGFAYSHNTPTGRDIYAPQVLLYLTNAGVFTQVTGIETNTTNPQEAALDKYMEALSDARIVQAISNRAVSKHWPPAQMGQLLYITSSGEVQPISILDLLTLEHITVPNAEHANNADHATDADNATDALNAKLIYYAPNQEFLSVNDIIDNEMEYPTRMQELAQAIRTQQQIIDGLGQAGLVRMTGIYNATSTYNIGDLVLGETITNGFRPMYMSLQNDNTGHGLDDTLWWVPQVFNTINDLKNYVNINADQTINGVKTFANSLIIPAPTAFNQPTTKQYVDDALQPYITTEQVNTKIDALHDMMTDGMIAVPLTLSAPIKVFNNGWGYVSYTAPIPNNVLTESIVDVTIEAITPFAANWSVGNNQIVISYPINDENYTPGDISATLKYAGITNVGFKTITLHKQDATANETAISGRIHRFFWPMPTSLNDSNIISLTPFVTGSFTANGAFSASCYIDNNRVCVTIWHNSISDTINTVDVVIKYTNSNLINMNNFVTDDDLNSAISNLNQNVTNEINNLTQTAQNNTSGINAINNELTQIKEGLQANWTQQFAGNHNPDLVYSKGDFVWGDGDKFYVSLQNNNNQPLSNNQYWGILNNNINIDLTTLAKLNEDNVFNGRNTFNGQTLFQAGTNYFGVNPTTNTQNNYLGRKNANGSIINWIGRNEVTGTGTVTNYIGNTTASTLNYYYASTHNFYGNVNFNNYTLNNIGTINATNATISLLRATNFNATYLNQNIQLSGQTTAIQFDASPGGAQRNQAIGQVINRTNGNLVTIGDLYCSTTLTGNVTNMYMGRISGQYTSGNTLNIMLGYIQNPGGTLNVNIGSDNNNTGAVNLYGQTNFNGPVDFKSQNITNIQNAFATKSISIAVNKYTFGTYETWLNNNVNTGVPYNKIINYWVSNTSNAVNVLWRYEPIGADNSMLGQLIGIAPTSWTDPPTTITLKILYIK